MVIIQCGRADVSLNAVLVWSCGLTTSTWLVNCTCSSSCHQSICTHTCASFCSSHHGSRSFDLCLVETVIEVGRRDKCSLKPS